MKASSKTRARNLNNFEFSFGKVMYWMSRDQRASDNWALIYAQELAENNDLEVVFCLKPSFLGATYRQFSFMIEGLKEVESNLMKKNIPFHVLIGDPEIEIPKFIIGEKISALVTDFDPLKIKRKWKAGIAKKIKVPFYEVDAHNIVPCWMASSKQEFGAYTIRPKIKKLISSYLKPFPSVKKRKEMKRNKNDWEKIYASLKVDTSVGPVKWIKPGEAEAKKMLRRFKKKLKNYSKNKNDPNVDAISNLSPYLHFGHIAASRVALEIKSKVFLEELIVRKELSDNFCFYNKNYDSFKGFPNWAKITLNKHSNDKREYIYSLQKLEQGKTHDDLWNAAQMQMIKTGKMHGYMRMYWAKKILQWTKTPQIALKYAIYLNDKYELDGRDPNGYTGIAWSIGGVHDRAWGERDIFGKVRYMSFDGCKSKFDVKKYISHNRRLALNISY
jgi:deoxyribodipyrimidine photo-lyase